MLCILLYTWIVTFAFELICLKKKLPEKSNGRATVTNIRRNKNLMVYVLKLEKNNKLFLLYGYSMGQMVYSGATSEYFCRTCTYVVFYTWIFRTKPRTFRGPRIRHKRLESINISGYVGGAAREIPLTSKYELFGPPGKKNRTLAHFLLSLCCYWLQCNTWPRSGGKKCQLSKRKKSTPGKKNYSEPHAVGNAF